MAVPDFERAITRVGPLPEGWQVPSVETIRHGRMWQALGILPPSHVAHDTPSWMIPPDEIRSDRTNMVVRELLKTAESIRDQTSRLVGLAASQLRQGLADENRAARIAILDLGFQGLGWTPGELTAVINPVVEDAAGVARVRCIEGCYTASRYFTEPEEAAAGVLKGFTPQGQRLVIPLAGYPYRIAKHETRHLDGTVGLAPDVAYRQGHSVDLRPFELRPFYASFVERGEPTPYLFPVPEAQWRAFRTGALALEDFWIPGDPHKP